MKARDALVAQGLAKQGRGKFSNDAKKWLNEQIAAGITFDDYPKDTVPTKSRPESKPTKKSTENPDVPESTGKSDYLFNSDYPWPENEYTAKAGKKSYSMREVCNNCRVSLVACGCGSPTIHGSIIVTITRR